MDRSKTDIGWPAKKRWKWTERERERETGWANIQTGCYFRISPLDVMRRSNQVNWGCNPGVIMLREALCSIDKARVQAGYMEG